MLRQWIAERGLYRPRGRGLLRAFLPGEVGWETFPPRVLQVVGLQPGQTALASVSTDATLTGNGTAGSPLSVVSSAPAAPTYIGQSHGSANAPVTLSKTLDAGAIQTGDLLLALVCSSAVVEINRGNFGTTTLPLGWNAVVPVQCNKVNGVTQQFYACYRWATAFESSMAAYTFGTSLTSAALLCIRGAGRLGIGFNLLDNLASDGAGQTDAPAIITTGANQLNIVAFAKQLVGWSAPFTTYTEVVRIPGVGGTNFDLDVALAVQASATITSGGVLGGANLAANYGAISFSVSA